MDNSIVLSDGGETTTMTITPANSQCTQITDKTEVPSPTTVLKLASLSQSLELSSPRTLPPTRPLLNSCIIVLTVASSMLVNVRISFFDDVPQEVDTLSFQIANSTAVSIALPTIQKEMNLEPAQLQWIMSAYSLSSVSKALCRLAGQNSNHQCRFYVLPTWTLLSFIQFLGLPLPGMRQTSGRLWSKTDVLDWIFLSGDIHFGLWILEWYVFFAIFTSDAYTRPNITQTS
jgi:hypothetical protein